MKRLSARDLTRIALMVGCIAVCSWISVPFPVPFTLQTFGVFFALRVLGGKKGCAAIAVYILLGAVGLPVFSLFRGGLAHLIGPTGGYIFGFLLSGIVYAACERIRPHARRAALLGMAAALAACYAAGTVWFVLTAGQSVRFGAALMTCVVPYIVPDLLKIALAEFLFEKLRFLR